MLTSGRLKWQSAVMAAMVAASIKFPSLFNMWTSTLICHTWSHVVNTVSMGFTSVCVFVCVFYLFSRHHTQRLRIDALGVPQASFQLSVQLDWQLWLSAEGQDLRSFKSLHTKHLNEPHTLVHPLKAQFIVKTESRYVEHQVGIIRDSIQSCSRNNKLVIWDTCEVVQQKIVPKSKLLTTRICEYQRGSKKQSNLRWKYTNKHQLFEVNCPFNTVFVCPHLPCSNAGEARGDSSVLKNMIPSLGRFSLGATSSEDTWAITLWGGGGGAAAWCDQPVTLELTKDSWHYWNFPQQTLQNLLAACTWFVPDPQSSIHNLSQMWSLASCSRKSVFRPAAAGEKSVSKSLLTRHRVAFQFTLS